MHDSRTHRPTAGFTLVELLIVVVALAVLAAVVVPSFGSSSEDAKASTLKGDLSALRNAAERYRAQHGGRFPGAVLETDGRTAPGTPGACQRAIVAQLTEFSDAEGKTSGVKSAAFPLGPYVKGGRLPANPFLPGPDAGDLTCEMATADLTAAPTADGTTGWKFYLLTGRLVANDDTTLGDGSKTLDF